MATLTPIPGQAARSALTPPLCLICGDTGGADLIRNVVLFAPMGLSLAAAGAGGLWTALAGFGMSLLVEGLQLTLVAGRDAALGDLVANSLGAAAGWALWRSRPHWLSPGPATARRLAGLWVVLAGAIMGFTWWGLAPDLPEGEWYGQWVTTGPAPEFFSGKVLLLRLGGLEVPHWRIPADLRNRLRGASGTKVRVEARIIRGPRDPDGRRVASLASGEARFLALATESDALFFSLRTRSARLRLQSPRFRLVDGLAAEAADTLTLSASYQTGRAWMAVAGRIGREASVWLTPLDSWVFVGPATIPGPVGVFLLRAATLAGLLGPLGLWLHRSRRRT